MYHYIPVKRNGIQGQPMYKTSPFVVRKLSEKQPTGVPMTIRFTGRETYTIEIEEDALEAWSRGREQERRPELIPSRTLSNEFRLGEPFTFFGFNFVIEPRDSSKSVFGENNRYLVRFESPENLANTYRSGLKVEPVKEGASVFTLSFDGYSPPAGSRLSQSADLLYGTQEREWKTLSAEKTIEFIDEQLGFVSDSLNLAENDMENFRLNNRFVDLTQEGTIVCNVSRSSRMKKTCFPCRCSTTSILSNI